MSYSFNSLTLSGNIFSNNLSLGGKITTHNALTISGNFPLTLTISGSTNITLPTAGTLATTSNVDSKLSLSGGIMTGNLTAPNIIKSGGTSSQYLMADGSSLQYSANSGNSNFYLYKSNDTLHVPPESGQVRYNNAQQSLATIVYISHLTSDTIDVEVFFNQISQLNDLYIQDKNNSGNFIKYNITGSPTIVVNSYISIPVVQSSFGGTGEISFGANHPTLISFFTNTIETDTRITTLETKTQNQTAISGETTFTGDITGVSRITSTTLEIISTHGSSISMTDENFLVLDATKIQLVGTDGISISGALNMNSNAITNLSTPVVPADGANKSYVDNFVLDTTLPSLRMTGYNYNTVKNYFTQLQKPNLYSETLVCSYTTGVSAVVGAYSGGVYSPTQNRIYFVPYGQAIQSQWHYVDCNTGNIVAYTTGVSAVGGAYGGGVYSPTQNRIYFVPRSQDSQPQWHYVDCNTGNIVAYTHGATVVSSAYSDSVYSPVQNRIYFVPYYQAIQLQWHYVDCNTGNIVAYTHGATVVNYAYIDGVYSPVQNRIYFVPSWQSNQTKWHYLQPLTAANASISYSSSALMGN